MVKQLFALMKEGNIVETYEMFVSLDGYRDSEDKANSLRYDYNLEILKSANIGDYIFLVHTVRKILNGLCLIKRVEEFWLSVNMLLTAKHIIKTMMVSLGRAVPLELG